MEGAKCKCGWVKNRIELGLLVVTEAGVKIVYCNQTIPDVSWEEITDTPEDDEINEIIKYCPMCGSKIKIVK